MRSVKDARSKLLERTKDGVDSIIELLERPIKTTTDDDKLKAAVDARAQAVDSIKDTLVFVEDHGAEEDFIRSKVSSLISACWECFDTLVDDVIPKQIKEDLEDERMKNAVIAKDVARKTSRDILQTIEQLETSLSKAGAEIKLKKDSYAAKIIEKRAKRVGKVF